MGERFSLGFCAGSVVATSIIAGFWVNSDAQGSKTASFHALKYTNGVMRCRMADDSADSKDCSNPTGFKIYGTYTDAMQPNDTVLMKDSGK